MARQHVDAAGWSAAPPPVVYGLLVDGATWPTWSGHDACELVQRGEGDGDGVGAVRVLRRGRVRSREQIVELVRDRRLGYVLLAGLPLRDYRADVDLRPERGGTAIRWSSRFRAKVPGTGWLFRTALGRFIAAAVTDLAARAEEVAAIRRDEDRQGGGAPSRDAPGGGAPGGNAPGGGAPSRDAPGGGAPGGDAPGGGAPGDEAH
jgi:hypothetical protein